MKICIVDGCENKSGPGRGMCHKHYKRWLVNGHTGLTSGRGCSDARERLAFRGKRTEAGCLEWTGTVSAQGYGQTTWMYKFYSVHRLSWVLNFGPIPDGQFVCHRCDNKRCFEPTHLFLGTHQQNLEDMVAKGRSTKWERNNKAKLTREDVARIRDIRRVSGAPHRELAKYFGVCMSTIARINNGQRWRDLPLEASRRRG
jgi:hypothetical protein